MPERERGGGGLVKLGKGIDCRETQITEWKEEVRGGEGEGGNLEE